MSSSLAACFKFQFVSSRTLRIMADSAAGSEPEERLRVKGFVLEGAFNSEGKSSGVISVPREKIVAFSITFVSSLIFPGHSYRINISMDALDICLASFLLSAQDFIRKCWANRGMSDFLCRSGGK